MTAGYNVFLCLEFPSLRLCEDTGCLVSCPALLCPVVGGNEKQDRTSAGSAVTAGSNLGTLCSHLN